MAINRRGFFRTIAAAAVGAVAAKVLPFVPAAKPLFSFGGFKPAGEGKIVGQILFQGNLLVRSPRMSKQIYGIVDDGSVTSIQFTPEDLR